MVELFKKHSLLILCIVFLILHLVNLNNIPIFNDEAIYLDWGWREIHGGNLFYSIYDEKQPFLMWLFGIAEGFSDPLIAGRFISVLFGLGSLFGIFYLGKDFFSKKTAIIASTFYTIVPLFSFFERQALMESAVASTFIWTVYLYLKLAKKASIKLAILLGIVLGISFFIKASVLILFAALVIIYILIQRTKVENKTFLPQIFVAVLVSQLILLPLYMQQLFWQNLGMNSRYSMGVSELIKFPIFFWWTNLSALFQIAFWYETPLVLLAVASGMFFIFRNGKKTQKIIAWIFLIQLAIFVMLVKGIGPRYVMPVLPLSVLFISESISKIRNWSSAVIVVLLLAPLYLLFLQLFVPLTYFDQLSKITGYSGQSDYVSSWTAGYATTSAINYIKTQPIPAIVAVRIDAGNPESAVFTYFHNTPSQIPTYLTASMIPNLSSYDCLTSRVPIYFVSRDLQRGGLDAYLQQEKRFYNPGNQTSVGVYQLKSCKGKTLQLD